MTDIETQEVEAPDSISSVDENQNQVLEDNPDEVEAPVNKTEERFKKILSKKNQAEKRISDLEDEVFYAKNAWADEYREDIAQAMERFEGMERDDAYKYVLWSKWIAPTASTSPWILWTPAQPKEAPNLGDMSVADLVKTANESDAVNKALRWE